jgi:LysM repeat protein
MSGRHRRPSKAAKIASRTVGVTSAGIAAGTLITGTAQAQTVPPAAVAGNFVPHHLPPALATVMPGDTLSKIAKDDCGNPADWTGIFAANKGKIRDPNEIYPGQQFTLSCQVVSVPSSAAPASVPYQGRHAVQVASAVSTTGMGGFQACVIQRESGGQTQVMNASGHYGLYQFAESTWIAHGGNPADFGHASAAEQTQVFWSTVHADGTSDWSPYDGC